MHLRASHKFSRLPKRFPVGATYVVEGRAGARGQLLVFSRYVVLPGGRRIDISANFGKFTPAAQPWAVPPKRTVWPPEAGSGEGQSVQQVKRTQV
jgi:hypothetical protein